MLQTDTDFLCYTKLTVMQVVNILFSAVKSMQKILADDTLCVYSNSSLFKHTSSNEPMENCVAPVLDKMWYIIKRWIVFSQSNLLKFIPTFEGLYGYWPHNYINIMLTGP